MPKAPAKQDHSLTPLQRAFADAYFAARVEQRDIPDHVIVRAAGYRGTDASMRTLAHRLTRNEAVLAHLDTLARQHMRAGKPAVAATLVRLTSRAKTERVQLDAAKALGAALGLTLPDGDNGAAGGPQLVVNLHFAGTQPTQAAADARIIQGYAEPADGDRSRAEGGGVMRIAVGAPSTQPAEGGGGGRGGGFAQPGSTGAGSPQVSPPQTSRVGGGGSAKNSRVVKRSGVKKRRVAKSKRGSSKGSSKAKAAKVGDPRDGG